MTQGLADLLSEHGGVLLAAVAVDSFREVNDTLGHQVGDDMLREVAARLDLAVPGALIGRIGGGRFAVATPISVAGSDAALFGLDLRAQVEGAAQLGVVGTHIRLSVGCVRTPDHGTDAPTLLRRAETAMNSARSSHGGPVLWEPAYEVQGQRRLAVVMALREALAVGAIGVAYQPKVSSTSGAATGVEALARWEHAALQAIEPTEFVPLAEAAGLMGQLTTTVLRQALAACHEWRSSGARVGVSVNVSADTLQDPDFVTEVSAILQASEVDPSALTLELTENVVVADPDLAAERMHELQALGLKLSVDDFGTGYSSLTYLKGLPIDEVKIDKGFIAGLVGDRGDQAVVRAVVDIAHTLGISVVAEGVEHEDQHRLLSRLGVDEEQGYLHAVAMSAHEVTGWLCHRAGVEKLG
jgi:diguanylate cyclase (GGDEF)-like protein